MSTIAETVSERNQTVAKQTGVGSTRRHESNDIMAYSTRIHVSEGSGVGMSHMVAAPAQRGGKRVGIDERLPKVKRRLQGFFIQAEGQDARVALVDKGALVHYYLPLSILHEAGVRAENQPFELDELEAKVAGVVMTGSRIRASAPAEAGEVRPLPLNDEYQQKLNRMLRR